ncbi:alpha/beta fold hydrolase [Streptomyces sp. NWU339]|uniref:alpha/beta hydrolase n=1 Tax=Streptomyces sp. NWU339 TaxID=2185284 RepID=UPI0015E7F28F|nr:alpha/beta hydrolase [Streptomyces sp. NWU339]
MLLDIDGKAVCARVRRSEQSKESTPVVLVAGGAGGGVDGTWGPLENRLAELGPVVTYDRAGSGHSDGPQHARVSELAEELHQVLNKLGVRQPVVVAGWSSGAFVAEGYALRYPEHVAGLVLIEPTPTEPPPRTFAVRLQLVIAQPLMRLAALASWSGLFSGRFGARAADKLVGAESSAVESAEILQLLRNPREIIAEVRVQQLIPRYAAELTHALEAQPLPDVPAVVISVGKRGRMPAAYASSLDTSHQTLAGRFRRGRRVVLEHATHQVPLEEPEVVVDAVRSVLNATEAPVQGLHEQSKPGAPWRFQKPQHIQVPHERAAE